VGRRARGDVYVGMNRREPRYLMKKDIKIKPKNAL